LRLEVRNAGAPIEQKPPLRFSAILVAGGVIAAATISEPSATKRIS
jgi:hypothetical protein